MRADLHGATITPVAHDRDTKPLKSCAETVQAERGTAGCGVGSADGFTLGMLSFGSPSSKTRGLWPSVARLGMYRGPHPKPAPAMSYTLEQLLWATAHRHVVLTSETAGALVLSVAEQLRTAPRQLLSGQLVLTESGSVLLGAGRAATPSECGEMLRTLLERLLAVCGAEHLPLIAVAGRRERRGPAAFAAELAVALIPFNRSAARRALQRLHRRLAAAGPPPTESCSSGMDVVVRADAAEPGQAWGIVPDLDASRSQPPDALSDDALSDEWGTAHGADEVTQPLGSLGNGDRAAAIGAPAAPRQAPGVPSHERVSGLPPLAEQGLPTPAVPLQPPTHRTPRAFERFVSRRSDVGRLLDEFAMETAAGEQQMAERLWRCVTAGDSGRTCTPPPLRAIQRPTAAG